MKDDASRGMKAENHSDAKREEGKDPPGKESEKRTLFVSLKEETSESLRYPESEGSTSEDCVTQEGMEGSMAKGCIGTITQGRAEESMAKGYIETVAPQDEIMEMERRLGYYGLRLQEPQEVPEANTLLEVVGRIEG